MALYEDIENAPGQVYDWAKRKFVSLTKPNEDDSDYTTRSAAVARQQKLAEALSQMGAQEQSVSTAGGITAPVSGMGALARGLTSFGGSYLAGKASADEAALEESQNKGIAAVFEGMKDTPDVTTKAYYLPPDQKDAADIGQYVPEKTTPGQHLSRSERTNRIMAGVARYPKMAALAPMYVQNMQSEVEDQRYATGQTRLDKQEADRLAQQALTNERNVRNDKFAQQEAARDNARAAQAHTDAMQARQDALEAAAEARRIARENKLTDAQTARDNKPESQFQAASAGFADRMIVADNNFKNPGITEAGTSNYQRAASGVPFIGNALISPEKRSRDQSVLSFTNAKLRQESGATIGDPEFVKADLEYFPQPFDDEKTIAQKAAERALVVEGMVRNAGPNYKRLTIEEKKKPNVADNSEAGKRARLAALKAQIAAAAAKPPATMPSAAVPLGD